MGRYIIRRLLWVIVLLIVVSAVTFLIFFELPSADPAVIRAGKSPNPQLIAQIRHTLGLDKPVYVQYWSYMKQDRLPLRLRLQLPELAARQAGDLRSAARHDLADGRRRDRLAGDRVTDRDHLGDQAPHRPGPPDDGRRAAGDFGPGLLAGAGRALPVCQRHRRGQDLRRRRHLYGSHGQSVAVVRIAALTLDGARRVVCGVLRPIAQIEPDRGDVGGLHPHGEGEGPARTHA